MPAATCHRDGLDTRPCSIRRVLPKAEQSRHTKPRADPIVLRPAVGANEQCSATDWCSSRDSSRRQGCQLILVMLLSHYLISTAQMREFCARLCAPVQALRTPCRHCTAAPRRSRCMRGLRLLEHYRLAEFGLRRATSEAQSPTVHEPCHDLRLPELTWRDPDPAEIHETIHSACLVCACIHGDPVEPCLELSVAAKIKLL